MGYWKKARNDFTARFALSLSGGEFKNGKFYFSSVVRRDEYERILRRLEEENAKVSAKSNSGVGAVSPVITRPVGNQYFYKHSGFHRPKI